MDSNVTNKEHSVDKEEAWQQFVDGDESCFKHVFQAYFEDLYGYGIKLSRRPELVRDCIQELFRSIWERRESLLHIESPNVYLFVSLRRKILKKVKRRRKTNGALDNIYETGYIQFAKEDLIIRDEVKLQQKEEISAALNQLSDRQKEVVYLHFYNGMSYGEIESILSINRQSVRNHMYRAMETLRSLLDTKIMKLVVSFLIIFFIS